MSLAGNYFMSAEDEAFCGYCQCTWVRFRSRPGSWAFCAFQPRLRILYGTAPESSLQCFPGLPLQCPLLYSDVLSQYLDLTHTWSWSINTRKPVTISKVDLESATLVLLGSAPKLCHGWRGEDVGALCWALVVGQGGTLNTETLRIWALLYNLAGAVLVLAELVVAPLSWHGWDLIVTQPKEEQSVQREGWKQQQKNSATVYVQALFAICIFFSLIHSPLCTAPYLTILVLIPECVPGGDLISLVWVLPHTSHKGSEMQVNFCAPGLFSRPVYYQLKCVYR